MAGLSYPRQTIHPAGPFEDSRNWYERDKRAEYKQRGEMFTFLWLPSVFDEGIRVNGTTKLIIRFIYSRGSDVGVECEWLRKVSTRGFAWE